MTVSRAEVVARARVWLNTPFHHQGRLYGVGVDCAGLVICVARDLSLVAPDFDVTGYARSPDGTSMLEQCDRFMRRIHRGEMQPGDVIVIRFESDPQHLAIVADYVHGGLSMIHARGTADGKGRVVEHRLDPTLRSRLVQTYALPGVS